MEQAALHRAPQTVVEGALRYPQGGVVGRGDLIHIRRRCGIRIFIAQRQELAAGRLRAVHLLQAPPGIVGVARRDHPVGIRDLLDLPRQAVIRRDAVDAVVLRAGALIQRITLLEGVQV
ncbi:MAG: hypothetical protein BWY63_03329 [Chloroflexi bacterium ADurb.Bin360]|nr:MAG: hypothetical protein BWY63_03329 [Chloroflexi bacterium ADurb.Bin360]